MYSCGVIVLFELGLIVVGVILYTGTLLAGSEGKPTVELWTWHLQPGETRESDAHPRGCREILRVMDLWLPHPAARLGKCRNSSPLTGPGSPIGSSARASR